jgi:hypothetical protein
MNLVRRYFLDRKRASAKALWVAKRSPCEYASIIYDAARPPAGSRILEFGANWGGNLQYILERQPTVEAVGVDINPAVTELQESQPGYRGIVGDESTLSTFPDRSIDLAYTVSVLDHIPSAEVVSEAIRNLARISARVLLLEPWIDGLEGDVSGRTRNQVMPGLPDGHKIFAPHSYLWNYDRMLERLDLQYEKRAVPLHKHSLGPFYYLYSIVSP